MGAGAVNRADEVRVSILRDPALVRTVRLVAAAVARRTGLDEEFVEEVRLAVGETCALLVGPADARSDALDHPVHVAIGVDDRFRVDVSTGAPLVAVDPPLDDFDAVEPWTLMRALVEDFDVTQDGSTTRVSMSWQL